MNAAEKLQDIKERPDRHRHSFIDLHVCCTVDEALDLTLLDAHSRYAPVGNNGGVPCDTIEGPCNCGAFH